MAKYHSTLPRICAFLSVGLIVLSGCSNYNPCVGIEYMSVRPTVIKNPSTHADDAEIIIYGILNNEREFDVVVENLTDDILTIDQTRSFFIDNGDSKAYYDPTVKTTSSTTTTGSSKGGAFNLGGIANAFGIGGIAGALMGATTLGGGKSQSSSNTYTEVVADMPQVSIGPRGRMAMSKTFNLNFSSLPDFNVATPDESPRRFSVSINYSFDNGESWNTIVGDYFVNSHFNIPVKERQTNAAVRSLMKQKPNAIMEPWYILKSKHDNTGCQQEFYQTPAFINIQ